MRDVLSPRRRGASVGTAFSIRALPADLAFDGSNKTNFAAAAAARTTICCGIYVACQVTTGRRGDRWCEEDVVATYR